MKENSLNPLLPSTSSRASSLSLRSVSWGRSIHRLVRGLRIDYPQSKDSSKEPLMRIVWLLSPEPLQLFMVEEGLHPKIVIHSEGLELLR